MRVTFVNVEVSFDAQNEKEAYSMLSRAMEELGCLVDELEWNSGDFITDEDEEGDDPHDTAELID